VTRTLEKHEAFGSALRLRVPDGWDDSEAAVIDLESQLTGLKDVVGEVREWLVGGSISACRQLEADLKRCLRCCWTLAHKIDHTLSLFDRTEDALLEQVRDLFRTRVAEEVGEVIQVQTDALRLLLDVRTR
jgi:hypothetical protein